MNVTVCNQATRGCHSLTNRRAAVGSLRFPQGSSALRSRLNKRSSPIPTSPPQRRQRSLVASSSSAPSRLPPLATTISESYDLDYYTIVQNVLKRAAGVFPQESPNNGAMFGIFRSVRAMLHTAGSAKPMSDEGNFGMPARAETDGCGTVKLLPGGRGASTAAAMEAALKLLDRCSLSGDQRPAARYLCYGAVLAAIQDVAEANRRSPLTSSMAAALQRSAASNAEADNLSGTSSSAVYGVEDGGGVLSSSHPMDGLDHIDAAAEIMQQIEEADHRSVLM